MKNISLAAMTKLYEAKQVIEQYTGAFAGHGSNALGLEAFLPLHRKDGGVDTAHFRLIVPWFSPPHWELLEVKRGVTPAQESAALTQREKIRHADVMRVREGIARIQGGMFAVVGGIGGIMEGAPLLGTLEATGGAEQVGLGAAGIATGKEYDAPSARAIQAVLEAAGVDPQTATFLAHHGGLLTALGRASVDAAGTAHAVIETSTGYRIQLEFDRATLSTNGLGGAKIKVYPLPPPVDKVRAPIGKGKSKPYGPHVKAEASESALAKAIGELPDEVVLLWGKQVTKHGADIISYNLKTKRVTLWDDKFRSDPIRIPPSRTFRNEETLERALREAEEAIRMSSLSKADKSAAMKSISERTYQLRTHGSGQVKNSTFGENK
jgi:hypothetical protein